MMLTINRFERRITQRTSLVANRGADFFAVVRALRLYSRRLIIPASTSRLGLLCTTFTLRHPNFMLRRIFDQVDGKVRLRFTTGTVGEMSFTSGSRVVDGDEHHIRVTRTTTLTSSFDG